MSNEKRAIIAQVHTNKYSTTEDDEIRSLWWSAWSIKNGETVRWQHINLPGGSFHQKISVPYGDTSTETPKVLEAKLIPNHPILQQKVLPIFFQGDYDTAVFQAFKQVEIAVREAGGYEATDYGTDLMRKAFHVDRGKLTDLNQPPTERQARSDLFAGGIGAYKNPSSHRNAEFTAEEAVEVIILAGHLLRIVDFRNQPEVS
ncbi:MAG: TIGR02391 family protein [Candidatus Dadabacteria bacterium]|nr:TIGR02391 family protein [Candidatus Dadabacteria bacterium]